jgi:sugar lactone lactonase YvrE
MLAANHNSYLAGSRRSTLSIALTLALALLATPCIFGKDKKDKIAQPTPETVNQPKNILEGLDLSKIVWPNPPAITRIRYLNYWSGEKFTSKKLEKKKSSWMERVAGVTTGETSDNKPRWQLLVANGVAVDSKGVAYIADSKVRAIFMVNTETGSYEMLRNGIEARFQWLTGLTFDDSDRLFAADSGMKRILVFDPQHKVEGSITEGIKDPGGMAVDNENRLLYVADAEQDLVLVYDADPPYKLLRKIGTPDKQHTLTAPGDFAKPTHVAVDQDGNLYVADTWNNRVEVFDADGNFIRTWGKAGDGPGYFARPKGIAIDSDGHIWVADSMQDRVQVFTPEGQLLIYMGGHGLLPGQFQSIVGLTIDKNNRVFTTEQFPGRMQMFRYISNTEAKAEKERRDTEARAKVTGTREAAKAKDSPEKK